MGTKCVWTGRIDDEIEGVGEELLGRTENVGPLDMPWRAGQHCLEFPTVEATSDEFPDHRLSNEATTDDANAPRSPREPCGLHVRPRKFRPGSRSTFLCAAHESGVGRTHL